MRLFTNLLVIYSEKDLHEYLCINTFYSFLGWFVAGKMVSEEQQIMHDLLTDQERKADIKIVLIGFPNRSTILGDNEGIINVNDANIEKYALNPSFNLPWQKDVQYIKFILNSRGFISNITAELIDRVMGLFECYNLRISEYTSKFYFHPNVSIVLNEYYDLYNEVYNMQEKYGMDYHYIFMKGKIARRIQEMHLEEKTETPFDIPKVIEMIEESSKDADSFAESEGFDRPLLNGMDGECRYFDVPIKYLEGCLLATESATRPQYYDKMLEMLEEVKGNEFKSLTNVYFRLGRSGISDGYTREETQKWLDSAIQIDDKNFRAIYRLAMRDGERHNYEAEWISLTRIETIFKNRKLLQPIEFEYLVKTMNMKAYLASEGFVDSEKAKLYLSNIESLDILKDKLNSFLRLFFGELYQSYYDFSLRRIRNYLKREGIGVFII